MAHKYQTGSPVGAHQYAIECLIHAITMYAVCACVWKVTCSYLYSCMYVQEHT